MTELKKILEDGVQMEDDFIETYMAVLKDEGFVEYFSDKEKARQLLQKLLNESQDHKQTLEKIINKI